MLDVTLDVTLSVALSVALGVALDVTHSVARTHLEGIAPEESFTGFTRDGVEVVAERAVAAHQADLVLRLLRHLAAVELGDVIHHRTATHAADAATRRHLQSDDVIRTLRKNARKT